MAANADTGEPLDAERWELANLQVSEDFLTPPLFADWISFTEPVVSPRCSPSSSAT